MNNVTDIKTTNVRLKYELTLGIAAMEGRGFYYPVDVAINENGKIYGLSRSFDGARIGGIRVCVLDIDSNFYNLLAADSQEDRKFVWPTAIALDSDHNVYITDESTHKISIFSERGDYIKSWGTHGSDVGKINGPCGIAFDPEDNAYISDHKNHRVQKFTKDGDYILSFGRHGTRDGEFNRPWGLTTDLNGNVYVADWRNDRIQVFSNDGAFIKTYGSAGSNDGEFNRPSSVAVDKEGYIFVADWGNERVQLFGPDGTFLAKTMGESDLSQWAHEFLASNPDELKARCHSNLETTNTIRGKEAHQQSSHIEKYFWSPTSVKLDKEGRVYVTDRNRHRIQVYRKKAD